jgi:hypothetical protein
MNLRIITDLLQSTPQKIPNAQNSWLVGIVKAIPRNPASRKEPLRATARTETFVVSDPFDGAETRDSHRNAWQTQLVRLGRIHTLSVC